MGIIEIINVTFLKLKFRIKGLCNKLENCSDDSVTYFSLKFILDCWSS